MTDQSPSLSGALQNWMNIFLRRSVQDFLAYTRQAGLTMPQLITLIRLYHNKGGCGVSDIGEHLGVTSAAASQMIDRLVNLGLLARTEDPQDRRAKQITLTSQGRLLMESAIAARRRWMEDLANSLPSDQQAAVQESLDLLVAAARKLDLPSEQQLS